MTKKSIKGRLIALFLRPGEEGTFTKIFAHLSIGECATIVAGIRLNEQIRTGRCSALTKLQMFTIRRTQPADADAIAKVHVDTFRSTYPSILAQTFLDAMSYQQSADRTLRRLQAGVISFVAEADGTTIGFADGGKERDSNSGYPGELYALYVLPAWHGQRVGSGLVAAVISELSTAKLCPIIVWVFEANAHARRFYERLGGRAVQRGMCKIDEQAIPEIGYELPAEMILRT